MTRARVKALHDEVNSPLTTLDLGTPLDGLLPHADVLCVIRYKAHQDPGEEETPRSREGEKQLDMEMIMKPKPTSLEALQGRDGRPGPGESTHNRTPVNGANRAASWDDEDPDRKPQIPVCAVEDQTGQPALSAPSPTWVAIVDTALLPLHQARHKITTLMVAFRPQALPQGMKTIIDLIAHMLVMKTLAPTLDMEKYIAMLVHMSVLHKTKSYNKIITKRITMPTMGVTTNPKTKVLKINLDEISVATLAMTNVDEENHTMIKMRDPTLSIVNNHDKIFNHILTVNQVKQVCTSNANPMLWLAVEDLLFLLKPQEMKSPLLVEETWRMKKTCLEDSSSPCRSSKEMELTMMRANIQESEEQTIARFFNGLNYPIKRIVEFQPYSNMVELVHQASKAERQVIEDIKYSKAKTYFSSKLATSTPPTTSTPHTTSAKADASSTPSKKPTIQSRMKQTVSSTASSKASTGPSSVTCFKCGTQGHKSFDCKNTKVMITMENGNIETLDEDEYEALVQAAVESEEAYAQESGEDPLLCEHDPSPSLVVTRVLTTQPHAMEEQRCNIFQTRAGIGGKSIKVIIDGGSCHNLASTELCEKLNLTLRKHPHPYHIQWLSDKGNVKIQHTVTVTFEIGPYEDTIECDVVPMMVCHMLLGRPWQYDKKAIHDGLSNTYTFKVNDKKFELRPMTPSQIIADNAKALARAQLRTHHSEMRGEGATHHKDSERHNPYMSETKSVLLATKSEWREVQDNPSTILHYVLICKGPSSATNDLTNIPPSLLSLLQEFQDVFPDELSHGLPPLRGIEHRIDLIPGAPLPNRAAYRTNPEETKEIQRQIQDLLAKGGYHQIRMAIGDEWKTAFKTKLGLYEWLVMPFGLSNAPSTFMRLMNHILRPLIGKSVVVYFDDILIYSKNLEDHVEAIHNWPTPTNVGQVRSFHGLAGFYRHFVKDFSTIACPLNELTKKNVPFVWGKAQQDAFDELKKRLTEAPLLVLPNFAKTFEIECDASGLGIGGVLMQEGKPVAYYSEKLDGVRLNYPIYDKELYALVRVLEVWQHYLWPKEEIFRLHGVPQSIVSDRDVKFMSYLWKSLMAKFGVKLLFSSSSHPQTDGQTEVVNRSLSTLLRILVKKNLKSWEECLPHAEFAYNRAKHKTTSRSPFMVVYGFEPYTALDILPLPLHERINMDFDKRTAAVKKLHEETRATIQEHVLRQANRINAKKKERIFQEGDLVWIHLRKERFPHERNSKLKPRGDGPFKVLKRINNNAYVIDIPTSKYLVSNTFNVSDLSPYHGNEEVQESRTTLSQGGGEMM
ncbi:hypothetical protein QYE76_007179 [Lolium multiflorum]|uniref:Reverse transcriptase n=1 Tax=Lolium multiflorum TaxID=4521 RepID=A0AAD8RYK7_LOLMU|nr:hypothetical protein QYE76_007179 [Lolium multiflorum]